jgi:hypothetical protein
MSGCWRKQGWKESGKRAAGHCTIEEFTVLYGHVMGKQGDSLKKEIIQGTLPGSRTRGRRHTACMDKITACVDKSLNRRLTHAGRLKIEETSGDRLFGVRRTLGARMIEGN